MPKISELPIVSPPDAYDIVPIVAVSSTGATSQTTIADLVAASAPATHAHAASEITSGTLDIARIPTGSTSTTVCIGNDSRLSNTRTPTSHASTHQNSGGDEIATATAGANAIPKAGAGGTLAIGWIPTGSTSTTVCIGNDSRLSDSRTPTSHVHSAVDITSGTMAIGQLPTGATASHVCIGNDSRLSDARTPSTHATSHKSAGADSIKLDELAATTDVTTLNASTSAHGLCPKLANDATKYLDGTGAWTFRGWDKILVSTSDATANNTQNNNHTELIFAVTNGEAWHVQLMGETSANDATGDVCVNLAATDSATWATGQSSSNGWHYSAAGAVTTRAMTAAASTTAMVASPGLVVNNGDNTRRPFQLEFMFEATASGNAKVQYGVSATTAGRTATLHKGAVLLARKIRVA